MSDPSDVSGADERPLEYLWLLDLQTLTVHLRHVAEGTGVMLHSQIAPEVDPANRIEGYAWDTFTGWSIVGTDYEDVDGELDARVQAALKQRHPLPSEPQLRRAAQLNRVPDAAPGDSLWLLGFFDDSVIVIPAHEAFRLAKLNRALEHASTWGELLAGLASDEITIRELEAKVDELPAADAPFDPNDIPGFSDGDWPAWPAQKMLEWLPESARALGSVCPTAINGDALRIPPERVDAVVAALTAEGIEVDVDAVGYITAACGDWRYE